MADKSSQRPAAKNDRVTITPGTPKEDVTQRRNVGRKDVDVALGPEEWPKGGLLVEFVGEDTATCSSQRGGVYRIRLSALTVTERHKLVLE